MKIQGKVALITGGAQGLGKGFTEAILDHGGQVCITDIDVEKGLETVREFEERFGPGSAIFVRCDVTNERDLRNAFDKTQRIFGRLDIMVNNAGMGGELSWKSWQKMIDLNLTAVIMGSKLALERMSITNGGHGGLIYSTSSTAGLLGVHHVPVYVATKHGVVGLTRSLGNTLATMPEVGVRVVCLCPSFTRTRLVEQGSKFGQLAHDSSMGHATVGVMEISNVVKAFLKLVDDDDNQGGVMDVTPKGMFYRYPRRLQSKL